VADFTPTFASNNTPSGFRPKPRIKARFATEFRLMIVPLSSMEKTRIGDWEVDLMMGGHGGGGLLTLLDRKTRFIRIEPVLSKHADHVADVIIRALSEIKGQVHTLTMDNGNEFAQHKRVAKALLAKVYFAHPYCAWERGANENTNGLLRPYFLKRTNVKTITQANIRRAENWLNNRPRKALEFRSPNEVFKLDKP
jgi:IS30 family transposase